MTSTHLGQVLLVEPTVPFSTIENGLQKLGWTREEDEESIESPLIPGEPELATWTWQGGKPFIIYTFNPVVGMRILDVATVPPVMRAAVASQWPMVDEYGVEKLLTSTDTRSRLLGLWAAIETERVDLIQHVQGLANDSEPVVADQAHETVDRLRSINEARQELLTGMHLLSETAPGLIRNLGDRSFVRRLKPREDDLAALFDEQFKPVLVQAADAIYSPNLRISNLEPDAVIKVFAAPAGLLRWPNMLSDKFPQGYREIAGWMNPKRVWLCWTVSTPSGGTVRYDGLAWLDGRWIWLPKIFRYLSPYLLEKLETFTYRH